MSEQTIKNLTKQRIWKKAVFGYAVAVALGLWVAFFIVGIWAKKIDCDTQGGVMVRGLFETVCIKGDAVQNLSDLSKK